MVDYRNIKVPDELIKEIISFIETHKELGYRTHSEFIIESIRKRLIELKEFFKQS